MTEASNNNNHENMSQPLTADEASPSSSSSSSKQASNNDSSTSAGVKRLASQQEKQQLPPSVAKKSRSDNVSPSISSNNNNESKSDTDFVDAAVTLGLKDGDQIDVQWVIELKDEEEDEAEATSTTASTTVTTRWWRAKLLPFDGRTKEQAAIRTLEYDPFPPHFPESSREDVVFLGRDLLVDPETREELYFRPVVSGSVNQDDEGGNDGDEEYLSAGIETVVNGILEGAMKKNQAAWNRMPPAQQAEIASKIADKRAKLVALLEAQASQTGVVTTDDVNRILTETMA